eukprot:jgi/Orpsp1_1/1177585/evm.model.c7180000062026.2
MSLSLLANYGSSSESEDENEIITPKIDEKSINNKYEKSTSNEKLSNIIPPPKNSFTSPKINNDKKHSLFSKLPEPKRVKNTKVNKVNKKYISLITPIEDDDDDEETLELKREIEEERKRKLSNNNNNNNNNFKTDNTNSNNTKKQGLFSLLPAPQNINKKNNENENKKNTFIGMIPLSLKKKQEKDKIKNNEKIKNIKKTEDAVENEEEKLTDDFFSLENTPKLNEKTDSEIKEISIELNNSNNVHNNASDKNKLKPTTNPEIDINNSNYINNQEYNSNQYQYPQKPSEIYDYNYNYYNQYYTDVSTSDSNFNNNILKLQEMGEFQMGEIKEINQKDQISNVYEVERTKQISLSNQPSINFKGIGK